MSNIRLVDVDKLISVINLAENEMKEKLKATIVSEIKKNFSTMADLVYKQGYVDGVEAFAYQKDGVHYVGSTGHKLKDILEKVEELYNYEKDIGKKIVVNIE